MQEKVRGQGYEAINGVALEIFKQRIAREVSVYRKVAAEANIQPE
jgi:hypothetical protein